jgi:O-antigen ligase
MATHVEPSNRRRSARPDEQWHDVRRSGAPPPLVFFGIVLFLAFAGVLATVQPKLVFAAVFGISAIAILTSRFSAPQVVTFLGIATAASMTWDGMHVPHVPIIFGDLPLFAMAGVLLVMRLSRTIDPPPPSPALVACSLLVIGGIVGGAFAPSPVSSMGWVALRAVPAIATLIIVRWWRPGIETIKTVLFAFVLGVDGSSLLGAFFHVRQGSGRSQGLTHHPNQLAAHCVMAIAICAVMVLWTNYRRVFFAGSIPLLLFGLMTAGSRSGVLALGLVAVLAGRRAWKQGWRFSQIGALVFVLALAFGGMIGIPHTQAFDRLFNGEDIATSDQHRLDNISTETERIFSHPITGAGLVGYDRAHSIYLEALSSEGLLGLIGLVWVIGLCCRRAFVDVNFPRSDELKTVAFAISLAFVGYASHEAFQNAVWNRWAWFMAGLALVSQQLIDDRDREAEPATLQASVADATLARHRRVGLGSALSPRPESERRSLPGPTRRSPRSAL